jgi:hypothetical protein
MLSEVGYLPMLARDLDTLAPDVWKESDPMREPASKLTWRLYQSMSRPTDSPTV